LEWNAGKKRVRKDGGSCELDGGLGETGLVVAYEYVAEF
jgi:hypothetical protein